MPKRVIRTSLSVVPLAARQGVPTVPRTASVLTVVLERCIPLSAPSAEMKPRCRSGPAVTDPYTAAIVSAGKVVVRADATKPTLR